jgi:hypothetical protein
MMYFSLSVSVRLEFLGDLTKLRLRSNIEILKDAYELSVRLTIFRNQRNTASQMDEFRTFTIQKAIWRKHRGA